MTLRVTLEIVPFGAEAEKRTIYTIDIGNQASQTKSGRTRYKACVTPSAMPVFKLVHYREQGAIKLARMALQRAEGLYK